MSTVIKVENLSKKYIIGHQRREQYQTLRDTLVTNVKNYIKTPLNWIKNGNTNKITKEEFWALDNVSFEVSDGDRLGIIGRNGAGKSTLLKILSRITDPTKGRIRIKGRVASLLEVGTGFHPELTGRENIFLNGAILGMSRSEIKRKFDEIVAFAAVERFLDTPVKRYSSGMHVRLAFSVAAHLEPDILIIDEVLAVGDAAFQQKCLKKMENIGDEGRTILFVSHNLATISALCDKTILIKEGTVAAIGDTREVVNTYLEQQSEMAMSHVYRAKSPVTEITEADLCEVKVMDKHGSPQPTLFVDDPFSIKIMWRLNVDVPFLRAGIDIIDQTGNIVISSMDTDVTDLHGKPRKKGMYTEVMSVPGFLLMPGLYTIKVFAGIPRVGRIMEETSVVKFEILENNTHLSHLTAVKRDGFIAMPLDWKVIYAPA